MTADPHVVIPLRLAQSVADYLSARPFKEVAEMLNGLARAKPVQFVEPSPEKPADPKEKDSS